MATSIAAFHTSNQTQNLYTKYAMIFFVNQEKNFECFFFEIQWSQKIYS